MVDVLRKEVPYDFDDTVEKIQKVCKEEGFGIFLVKAIDEVFKEKLGVNYPRMTTILACAPPLAKMAVDVSLDMANMFPCSFVVYEENRKTFVMHASIMKMGVEAGLAPADAMAPVIAETGKRVHKIWDRI